MHSCQQYDPLHDDGDEPIASGILGHIYGYLGECIPCFEDIFRSESEPKCSEKLKEIILSTIPCTFNRLHLDNSVEQI